MNLTTLSLLNVKDCDIAISQPITTNKKIQLLQTIEFSHVQVIQCKVEIQRSIFYCGRWSYVATVAGGHMEYIHELSRDICRKIHNTSAYEMHNTMIENILANATTTSPITLAGTVNSGNCAGTSFSDHYGSWDNVVVHGQISITIQDYMARVNLDKNELYLRSGVKCAYNTGHCMDTEGGDTYWDILAGDQCN